MFNDTLKSELADILSAQLPVKIQINRAERIYGGDINETWRLDTSEGSWLLKLNDARRFPNMFEKESRGLELLRNTGVVKVPAVLAQGITDDKQAFLLTEYIEKEPVASDFWESFAVSMSKLHQHTQPYFGLNHANYIGLLKQYNTPYTDWSVFYAFNRLLPMARMAYDQKRLERPAVQKIESICKRLPEMFPQEPPALLHGDMWSGNFLIGPGGKACIFDPAVYYGHREMELAMTRLFGGFDTRFYYTYHAIRPLAPGWQLRIGLCQLYPLLVHLNLFGGSFYNDVLEVLEGF